MKKYKKTGVLRLSNLISLRFVFKDNNKWRLLSKDKK